MMSFCNSTHVRGGISLAGLMYIDVNVLNLRKPVFEIQEMENYFPRIADGINWIATSDSRAAWTFETSTREFSGTLEASFVNSTRDCYQTCINDFCESIKKGLMFDYIPVYGYSAPAKSGAGIGVLVKSKATHDAPSVFFCAASSVHPFFSGADSFRTCIRIMVGWAGASSEAPVPFDAGYANPVQSITSEIGVSGDGFHIQSKEAAIMATASKHLHPKYARMPGKASAKPRLTQKHLHEILHYDPDTGIFCWKVKPNWRVDIGDVAGSLKKNGYIAIVVHGERFPAHRLAWFYVHGYWSSKQIDHINLDKTDNRLANLREATRSQNQQNKGIPKNNTSGIKGVSWNKAERKWVASCWLNNKRHHIGHFDNISDADKAVREFREKNHGEFANHGTDALASCETPTPTQKPQFIWIITAVRRDMPTIKAQIHHITAHSERDARRFLVRDHVCFFAGRIRLEVAHA